MDSLRDSFLGCVIPFWVCIDIDSIQSKGQKFIPMIVTSVLYAILSLLLPQKHRSSITAVRSSKFCTNKTAQAERKGAFLSTMYTVKRYKAYPKFCFQATNVSYDLIYAVPKKTQRRMSAGNTTVKYNVRFSASNAPMRAPRSQRSC
jgi:hypothetical protein